MVNQWAEPSINSGNATFTQIKEFHLAGIHMVYRKSVKGPPAKQSVAFVTRNPYELGAL